MSNIPNWEEPKEHQVQIPTIYIENNFCSELSAQDSPPFGFASPFFVADGDALFERPLPLNFQISQFVCWFNELSPSKQFLFTALSLQNLSAEFVPLSNNIITDRLSKDENSEYVYSLSHNIDHLRNLSVASEDLPGTLVTLLSHLHVPNKSDVTFCNLREVYVNLVNKAIENAILQKSPLSDSIDAHISQLILIAMSSPLFSSADKQWLRNNIKARSEEPDAACHVGNLLNLTNCLFEAFEEQHGSNDCSSSSQTAGPRSFRSSSINSQFPFLPRALFPYLNRRHHSLIPPTSSMENSLCVPSPFTSPHLLSSSSSLNSSGFVSGSESMYQGLNEAASSLSMRGIRLGAPSNSRLYPNRRQSASPYTFHGEQLKEEEDSGSIAGYTHPQEPSSSRSSIFIPGSELDHTDAEDSRPPLPLLHLNLPQLDVPRLSVTGVDRLHSPIQSPQPSNLVVHVPPDDDDASASQLRGQNKDEKKPTPGSVRRKGAMSKPSIDIGMAYVPLWLKGLRLHKYAYLFEHLAYSQMLQITDDWLQAHLVTQGARNKILVSIAALSMRPATIARVTARLSSLSAHDRSSTLRSCFGELRSLLQTPFPPSSFSQPRASTTSSPTVEEAHLPNPTVNYHFASDDDDEDDGEEDFPEFEAPAGSGSGSLCDCVFTNSDTCLFDRVSGEVSPKRPKSSEGGGGSGQGVFFFPPPPQSQTPSAMPRRNSDVPWNGSNTEWSVEEHLPDGIMKCLEHGLNAVLYGPKDDLDSYGSFMQLLTTVIEHPSFSKVQKERVTNWQRQLTDSLGPAPAPPRRSYSHHHHHHRNPSRRSSLQPPGRGGSHSAPFVPRGNTSFSATRSRFNAPLRSAPYQHRSAGCGSGPSGLTGLFLQPPQHSAGHWMLRGRSAEPDAYHHQHAPAVSMAGAMSAGHRMPFGEPQQQQQKIHPNQPIAWACQQQRVGSMDSLAAPMLFPNSVTEHQMAFHRNRMASYHGPLGDGMNSLSPHTTTPPFPTSSLHPTCYPPCEGVGFGGGSCPYPGQHPSMSHQTPPHQHTNMSIDYSTAEINRNLDLLTQKVTKLAIEESDSPSE